MIDPLGLFQLYGYQTRGTGEGWQPRYKFKFNPITKTPSTVVLKMLKLANRINSAINFMNTTPAGPLHPYKKWLQCGKFDVDLEKEYLKLYPKDKWLTPEQALSFLNSMSLKYPEFGKLYPNPMQLLNTATNNSKNHWFYKLRPEGK